MGNSLTVRAKSPAGFPLEITLTGENLVKQFEKLESWMTGHGYTPPEPSPAPAPAQTPAPAPGVVDTFIVESIEYGGKTMNGKSDFWRVKGGSFRKHGLSLYDDMVAMWGLDLGYDTPADKFRGAVATYSKTAEGKPRLMGIKVKP